MGTVHVERGHAALAHVQRNAEDGAELLLADAPLLVEDELLLGIRRHEKTPLLAHGTEQGQPRRARLDRLGGEALAQQHAMLARSPLAEHEEETIDLELLRHETAQAADEFSQPLEGKTAPDQAMNPFLRRGSAVVGDRVFLPVGLPVALPHDEAVGAELHAIAVVERGPLHHLAVQEDPVGRPFVHHDPAFALAQEGRMETGDGLVVEDQMVVRPPPHRHPVALEVMDPLEDVVEEDDQSQHGRSLPSAGQRSRRYHGVFGPRKDSLPLARRRRNPSDDRRRFGSDSPGCIPLAHAC